MIKKAKHCESEKWKAAREQVSVDMDEEIQRHLRKIKKDLLGQEPGDLRSCVMKFLDTSPADALRAVFDCCLEMFNGKREKTITKFLNTVVQDSIGRRLFQLALNMSCKRLLGDALEELVENKVKAEAANSKASRKEIETKPVPPSEGLILLALHRSQYYLRYYCTWNLSRVLRFCRNFVMVCALHLEKLA